MELLLRQFREQHLRVDGNVTQTVQRAAFSRRWNCCSDSSESSVYQLIQQLLKQFRELYLPVDATVAQTVQRATFTSRCNCSSDSSESNIYQ